ncbi:terminase gpA endonuclease subunit [Symmachiella dynata]|uniref:terminase gpA endonuclease subunit n=1 Tax=Symmachiella dynata TaxID=2527995 RepID=UPI0030EB634B
MRDWLWRWATAVANRCSARKPRHRLFAEQVTAEYFVKTEGRGRKVDEWKMRPEQSGNHWLDCLAGSEVAASIQGAVLFCTGAAPPNEKKRLKLSELQRSKR